MAQKRVAVFVDMTSSYGRGILAGISHYTRTHSPWIVSGDPERVALPIEDLAHWPGDGIIAQAWQQSMTDVLTAMGKPVVNAGWCCNSSRTFAAARCRTGSTPPGRGCGP